jgi:hypothetical protein
MNNPKKQGFNPEKLSPGVNSIYKVLWFCRKKTSTSSSALGAANLPQTY